MIKIKAFKRVFWALQIQRFLYDYYAKGHEFIIFLDDNQLYYWVALARYEYPEPVRKKAYRYLHDLVIQELKRRRGDS